MTGISMVIGPLQKLLEYFQRDRHFKSAQKDEALRALHTAISETLEYIEKSDGEKCFIRGKEYELSNKWSEAALKIRHVSNSLAERLQNKADFWADQLEWSRQEIEDKQIDLQGIRSELRKLLKDS